LGLEVLWKGMAIYESIASYNTHVHSLSQYVEQCRLLINRLVEELVLRAATYLSRTRLSHERSELPRGNITRDVIEELFVLAIRSFDSVVDVREGENIFRLDFVEEDL
jgi:hypothetical protein